MASFTFLTYEDCTRKQVHYKKLLSNLWKTNDNAWRVSLILAGLGIMFSLIGLTTRGLGLEAVITLILDAVIIYYLTQINVKGFFGKVQLPIYAPIPQSTSQPRSMSASVAPKFCANCGGQ